MVRFTKLSGKAWIAVYSRLMETKRVSVKQVFEGFLCFRACLQFSLNRGAQNFRVIKFDYKLKNDRRGRDIDLFFADSVGEIVCEHTSIDPSPNNRGVTAEFEKIFSDFEISIPHELGCLQCKVVIPDPFFADDCSIDPDFERQYAIWERIYAQVCEWDSSFYSNLSSHLFDGLNDYSENFEFEVSSFSVRIRKLYSSQPGKACIHFLRGLPSEWQEAVRLQIKKAFKNKLPKLAELSQGKETLLLLELPNPALQNTGDFSPALKEEFENGNYFCPDHIVIVETKQDKSFDDIFILRENGQWKID